MSYKTWPQKLIGVNTLDDARKVLEERKPYDSLFTAYTFLGEKMDVRYFELLRREIDLAPVAFFGGGDTLDFLSVVKLEKVILKRIFQEGHIDLIRYFISIGLPLTTFVFGYTVLTWAVEDEKVDAVDVILEQHIVNVEEGNVERRERGEEEVSPVDILYQQTEKRADPITCAILTDNVAILQRFYIHGADFSRSIDIEFGGSLPLRKADSYLSVACHSRSIQVLNYFTGLGIFSDEMILEKCDISSVIYILQGEKCADDACEDHIFFQHYFRSVRTEDDLGTILTEMRRKKEREKVFLFLVEEMAGRRV